MIKVIRDVKGRKLDKNVSKARQVQKPNSYPVQELRLRGLLEGEKNSVLFLTSDNFGLINEDKILLRNLLIELDNKHLCCFAQVGLRSLEDEEFLGLINSFNGQFILSVGVESIYKGLDHIKKDIQRIRLFRILDKVKKYENIYILMLLMIGFDFEPINVFEDLLKFICESRPSGIYVSILIPLPGSKIEKKLRAEGRIFDNDWGHYDTRHLVFERRYQKSLKEYGVMSPAEFMEGYNWLLKEAKSKMGSWNSLKIAVR